RPRRPHHQSLRLDHGADGGQPGLHRLGRLGRDRDVRPHGSGRGALSGGARAFDGALGSARRVRLRGRHADAHRRVREAAMKDVRGGRVTAGRRLLVAVAGLAAALATVGGGAGTHARSLASCTDLYTYANSGWLAANPIPEGQSRWSPRTVGRAANRQRLQSLLEAAADEREATAGSPSRIAGDFYASCMDEPRVDAAGVTP